MIIKKFFAILVEIVTGRRCSKCRYFAAGECYRPSSWVSWKCQTGVYPVGYEKKGD